MQVHFPIFVLSLLVHAGIFLTSRAPDRRLRMMAGLAVLFSTWPAWYSGMLLGVSAAGAQAWLARLLTWAPYYLPVCSFLVYRRNKPD